MNLTYKKLSSIPKNIFKCKIKELDISSNKITKIEKGSLPKSLKKLDISHNLITNIEKGSLPNFLEEIDISFNRISKIEKGSLPKSLKKINMSFNPISIHTNIRNIDITLYNDLELRYMEKVLKYNYIVNFNHNVEFCYFHNLKLSNNFIEWYIENSNNKIKNDEWKYISEYQLLSMEFIEKYNNKIDWDKLNIHLSEEFIEKWHNKVNWIKICYRQELSMKFIEKWHKKLCNICWEYISEKSNLNEEFIEKWNKKIHWKNISEYYAFSENFVNKWSDKLNFNYVLKNSRYSDEFYEKYKDKVIEYRNRQYLYFKYYIYNLRDPIEIYAKCSYINFDNLNSDSELYFNKILSESKLKHSEI